MQPLHGCRVGRWSPRACGAAFRISLPMGNTYPMSDEGDAVHVDGRAGTALARLWEISLLLGEHTAAGLAERGLTRARAELLAVLGHGGPMTQRDLAREMGVTPRAVTGLVDALQSGGYLARNAHPADRRATLVALTEQGNSAVATLLSQGRTTAAGVFADFGDDELDQLGELLDRVLRRCRDLPGADSRASSRGR